MTIEERIEIANRWQQEQLSNLGCGTPFYVCFIISIVFFLSSCATRTVVEYRDHDVNHYITKVEKDTVMQNTRDSVYFEVIQKGDTVFATKYKEKYIYLDKIQIKRDTCWRDSVVTQYKENIKEVTKIPKIYKISLGLSIFFVIFATLKLVRWLKKR